MNLPFLYMSQNLICDSGWTTNPSPFYNCMSISVGNTFSEFCDSSHFLIPFNPRLPCLPSIFVGHLCLSLCLLSLMGRRDSWMSCLVCSLTSILNLCTWSKRFLVKMDMLPK